MAYDFSILKMTLKFTQKLNKKTLIASIKSQAEQTRRIIELPQDWQIDPASIKKRVERVMAGDFEFFVATYFPHFVRSPHKSELHTYLFDELPKIAHAPKGVKLAIAAPRGEAKSTLVSRLYTLFRIATKTVRYAIIIMDSIDQAYPMLDAIKSELESNPRLKTDFPEIFGQGRVWRAGVILTRTEVKIEVAGSGKRLRGKVHGAYRPDLVILDDIENDKNVQKPEQRDKLQHWLMDTVEPLGVAGEKLDIIYIGTILHYDSVLNRTLKRPDWQRKKFKAIVKMPDNMALWDEWESLYLSDDKEGADRFYQQNQDKMVAGSQVSWLARPLLDLMIIRANSRRSFDSEYQNDPTAGDDAPFANAIHFWATLPDTLIYFGAVDPSLGKAGASRDPSAIVVAGLDRTTGKVYVVEASIKKRVPDKIISDVIAMQEKYRCTKWAVEAVQFQEFLHTELVKRGQAQGIPIPAMPVKPHTDKLLRIESLQTYMTNRVLLLHPQQSTLIDQFRHFPKADHDDGCDAVEMVYKLATSYQRQGQMTPLDVPMPSGWR